MKHIPLKIFVIVLIGGIIGIVGEVLLKYDIERLSSGYRMIVDDCFTTLSDNGEIRNLMHSHQTLMIKHTTLGSENEYDSCERDIENVEKQLIECFNELGEHMKGGRHEQVYHKAYTSFRSYLQNSDVTLEFSRTGRKNTADFYIVNVLDDCTNKVNTCLDNMESFLIEETKQAQEMMDGLIAMSRVSSVVCIVCIVAATTACLFLCVRITTALDQYKNDLECDVEQKSAALREHSEKMLRIQNSTIMGLANLIESRDGETGEHVKRTSKYVMMLARTAQAAGYHLEILTDEYIELIVRAAPLHDIGKISVPDSVLKKQGKLTDEEYGIMKTHAGNGGRIIRDVIGGIENKEYVEIASDIAAYHHEKWNGTGYGMGLSGESIPLCARIMAVADVFDALISERCYKKPFSLDKAFKIIEEESGTHFDPVLAELFVELRGEIEEYLNDDNNTAG